MENKLTKQEIEDIKNNIATDVIFRKSICEFSHKWFFTTYFSEYIKYPSPDFHDDLFLITEDAEEFLSVIVAFRGSAKSTIMALSNPIWAMIGSPQKKHIVIISRTKELARKILQNIKSELETNRLLINDFGPFITNTDSWNSEELHINKYKTTITSLSVSSNKRGLRDGSNRPDLIICDDIQDMDSVKTKENRDRIYDWYVNEIVPLGDLDTKIIIIGNLLHEDSLVSRLKRSIREGKRTGIYREYPLMDENGLSLWPEKFSLEEIRKLQMKLADDRAFAIEYLLKILPRHGQIINRKWLHYYSDLPDIPPDRVFTGVDLAVSQKNSGDCTSIVTIYLYGYFENWVAYVLPTPINARLRFPEATDAISRAITTNYLDRHYLAIESNGYQLSMIQQLENKGVVCKGFPSVVDKYVRLNNISAHIKKGTILFPDEGAEDLITQIIGLGVEKHDDLVDAFSLCVNYLLEVINEPPPQIYFI